MRQVKSIYKLFLVGIVLLLFNSIITAQASMLARILDGQYASLYAGPGFNYNVLRQLSEDNVLTLIGRNEDGAWAYAITANQTEGWIEASKLRIQGNIFALPVTSTTAAIRGDVLPGLLNLRTGPSPSFGVIARVAMDVELDLIGRNVNTTWIQVNINGFGIGWVDATFIDANNILSDLPVTSQIGGIPPAGSPIGTITAQSLNVRRGAGLQYQAFTGVSQNQYVWLIARTADSNWLLVQTPSGQVGWVSARFIRTQFLMANLPISQ